MVDSILLPSDYVVSGYQAGQMLTIYPQQLGIQDLADIIEYIKSTDPNYVAP
ncbi:MAG: hypothetical protein UZ13_01100 [Chloroflexi bacterium OLB13]|nr:MAG: hypothetical protein UZ13_01100 [Chloroflexi bacterium OLB13]